MNISKEESQKLLDKYADREWEYIQTIDFPKTREHEIKEKSLFNEWNSLCKNDLNWKTRSSLVTYFNPSIVYSNKGNKLSPVEYWETLKSDKELFRKFLDNRYRCSDWYKEKPENWKWLEEGRCPEFIYGIGLSTSGRAPKVSYFKPAQMKFLITNYANEFDTIFDPFAGFAGRMLGTLACDKNYIGYDLSKMTIDENKACYKWLVDNNLTDKSCELKVKDSLKESGKFDCIITCPPYSDAKGKQKEEWRDSKLNKISCAYTCDEIIDICLERYDCKKYIFVVDNSIEKYKDNIVDSFENVNYFGARNGKHTSASYNNEVIVEIIK